MKDKWRLEIDGDILGPRSPIPYAPAREDPARELVVTTREAVLLVDAENGQVEWSYRMPSPVSSSAAAVGDVDGDGWNEIVVVDDDGNMICLSPKGEVKWALALKGQIQSWEVPVLADLGSEGRKAVVIGNTGGLVTCVDHEGKALWRFQGDRGRIGPICVGDVDGDGRVEIVFGSDSGRVYCLSGEGAWLWETEQREDTAFGRSAPLLADVNSDGRLEILIGKSFASPKQRLYCLDGATGRQLWEYENEAQIYTCLAAGDIDGDGRLEILFGDKANVLYCIDGFGKEKWRASLEGTGIFSGPVLADVNGDGSLEVMVGSRGGSSDGSLYVLNHEGEVLERRQAGGRGVQGSPMILGSGSRSDLFYVTSGPGALICLEGEGPAQSPWPCYRGNPQLTGYLSLARSEKRSISLKETRSAITVDLRRFQGPFLGENECGFEVSNPTDTRLVLSLSSRGPEGSFTRLERIGRGTRRLDFRLDITAGGHHSLHCSVIDPKRRAVLARLDKDFDLSPPGEDIAYLGERLEEVEKLRARLEPVSMGACKHLRSITLELRGMIRELEDFQGQGDAPEEELRSLASELGDLRRESSRVLDISGFLLEHGANLGSDLLVWNTSNPWDAFGYKMTIPPEARPTSEIRLMSYVNEYESFAINITNVGMNDAEVIVTGEELKGEGNAALAPEAVQLRQTMMSSYMDRCLSDALPALDQARGLTIPPWETRQLWLTLQAKDCDGGEYVGRIKLRAIGVGEGELEVPLRLKVYPVVMPSPSRMAFCNWTGFLTKDERRLKDLLDHYTNVFIAGSPPILFDEKVNLVEEPAFEAYDKAFQALRGKARFLVAGFQNAVRFRGDVEYMSETWREGYAKALKLFVAHLREIGIGYEDFAFYSHDEPGLLKGPIIDAVYEVARLTKEIDPCVQIYANPTGRANSENLAKLRPYVDIWCPFLTLIKRDPELLEFLRGTGKPLWCYEAEGRVKELHPLDYYRMQPWVAWRYGLDGAGFWTYEYRDLWDKRAEYGLIYGGEGPVPSKRWEAYRDGIEDYNYLALLSEVVEEAEARGVASALVKEARSLMQRAVAEITEGQERVDDIMRWVEDFPMDFEKLILYRQRIAEVTVALRGRLNR